MSGLTEAHILCVSVQMEFSKRQSDGQGVDLLVQDACERERQAGRRQVCPED